MRQPSYVEEITCGGTVKEGSELPALGQGQRLSNRSYGFVYAVILFSISMELNVRKIPKPFGFKEERISFNLMERDILQ